MKLPIAPLLLILPLGLLSCADSPRLYPIAAKKELTEEGVVGCPTPEDRERLGPFDSGTAFPAPLDDAHSTGVTVGDINSDGRRDVWLPTDSRPQVFVQQEDGSFLDEWERLPAPLEEELEIKTAIISLIDLDGDGDLDAFVGQNGEHTRILENTGDGVFERIRDTGGTKNRFMVRGFFWGDMDADGDLDLAVANDRSDSGPTPPDPGHPNKLFERVDTWEWRDVSERLETTWANGYTKFTPWFDHNADGAMDLYIINHMSNYTGNHLLENDGTGNFTEVSGTGLDMRMSGMGYDVADLNGDLLPDMIIADQASVKLLLSDEQGWHDAALARGLDVSLDDARYTAWSSTWSDFDNDGRVDVFTSFAPTTSEGYDTENLPSEQRDALWLQNTDGTFRDVAEDWGMDHTAPNRGAAVVDLDGDGWLDILKSEHLGPTVLFRARCGSNAWLMVDLEGPAANPHGIGARVTITHDGTTQTRWIRNMAPGYLSSQPPEAHFGLGEVEVVDRLTVTWPDGTESLLEDVDARQRVTVDWPAG